MAPYCHVAFYCHLFLASIEGSNPTSAKFTDLLSSLPRRVAFAEDKREIRHDQGISHKNGLRCRQPWAAVPRLFIVSSRSSANRFDGELMAATARHSFRCELFDERHLKMRPRVCYTSEG
jgi:hypothetical protein